MLPHFAETLAGVFSRIPMAGTDAVVWVNVLRLGQRAVASLVVCDPAVVIVVEVFALVERQTALRWFAKKLVRVVRAVEETT
jgi:hypothetical protein